MLGALKSRGVLALAIGAAACWTATFALMVTDEPQWAGVLAVLAATATVAAVIYTVRRDAASIYKHGYHAGWHAALHDACPYPGCDIVELAERRALRDA